MTAEERIRNRKVTVIGMARSGMAAALLAESLGADVFVSESKTGAPVAEQVARLKARHIACETGGHTERALECDYIVLSPGVPPSIEILKGAEARGIPVFSEIEFASWICRGRIVAVTGSNGKTTTTTLIGEILAAAGLDTFVCGNIGLPFAQVADKVTENAVAVVEVSTFQLEKIADFRPDIALILNLSPDHLDRHGTYEAYKRLKYRITENQGADDYLILNLEDADSVADNVATTARKVFFTTQDDARAGAFVREGNLYSREGETATKIIPCGEIGIRGPHNLQNSAAAVCAARLLDVAPGVIADVLRRFGGVEHRLEKVDRIAGIDFVNDSKATNVDSVCYALRSIDTPIYLIGGGRAKGSSYAPIVEYGRGKVKGVFLIGEAREQMFSELGKAFPTQFAETLEEAVKTAFGQARPGETVLLSPGCASFDMFDNFEQRGEVFKNAVAALKASDTTNETVTK